MDPTSIETAEASKIRTISNRVLLMWRPITIVMCSYYLDQPVITSVVKLYLVIWEEMEALWYSCDGDSGRKHLSEEMEYVDNRLWAGTSAVDGHGHVHKTGQGHRGGLLLHTVPGPKHSPDSVFSGGHVLWPAHSFTHNMRSLHTLLVRKHIVIVGVLVIWITTSTQFQICPDDFNVNSYLQNDGVQYKRLIWNEKKWLDQTTSAII